MTAYYNENDPKAAAWLRELIKQGHIAYGVVDERSIEDIRPDELAGFTQCHFFAGIGVWSYALRRAGWPDDRRVWTGSCPCQPFSAAGKGGGFADERHLWPAWHWLISECKPPHIFGEQVASKDGLNWFDLVHADLEAAGYAVGAADTCAAGFGAPHIRQRLYFVADTRSIGDRTQEQAPDTGESQSNRPTDQSSGRGIPPLRLAVTDDAKRRTDASGRHERDGDHAGRAQGASDIEGRGEPCGLDNSVHGRHRITDEEVRAGGVGALLPSEPLRPGPVNGLWRDADWLHCTDGKWRPVEPGTFPLAHGAPARVGRLRGYGNAIVAQAAQGFIEAYLETQS